MNNGQGIKVILTFYVYQTCIKNIIIVKLKVSHSIKKISQNLTKF